MYKDRNLILKKILEKKSVLLLGPRRTGKSTYIKKQINADATFNLLEADTFRKLSFSPESIRKSLQTDTKLIVIDEIQKLPGLMDEVHLMIEDYQIKFLLTGSSARKLHKSYTSLMAGRATRLFMHPFNSQELKRYDLNAVLLYGTIPAIYESDDPYKELSDYVGLYLKEEILAEALVRKIENFSRFLDFAATTNGQILNFEQLSQDAQVPARTIREYYQLLEDTLFGTTIYPIKSTKKRKSSSKGKFYFFDLGVVSALLRRQKLNPKTPEYGSAFEHFILLEMICYKDYLLQEASFSFWQDYQSGEVDFIINEEIAVEVKATKKVRPQDLESLKKFISKGPLRKHYLVSQDPERRIIEEIELIPYQDFLAELWSGKIF